MKLWFGLVLVFLPLMLSSMDTRQECLIVTGNNAEMDPALLFSSSPEDPIQ